MINIRTFEYGDEPLIFAAVFGGTTEIQTEIIGRSLGL
jgi:hypothetical protein